MRLLSGIAAALGVVAALAGLVVALNRLDEGGVAATPTPVSPSQRAELARRGEYLVRAGGCVGCHTERGGTPFAGARAIETPFGIVYAGNLTPDPATGLGSWRSDDFWRALHNGRSRDGRLLYPAFPYPNYTRLTRADADAMFAYLQTLAPEARTAPPHALAFPFGLQASLAVWRALFFRPGSFVAEPGRSAAHNRGAYLVEALGHCSACHSRRNAFGATASTLDLAGGLIPIQNWYAPSLTDPAEAGVADWSAADVVALLKTGVAPRGSVQGPMAEVVARSTGHLSDPDLAAMAAYLRGLPVHAQPDPPRAPAGADPHGARLYGEHCAQCHGAQGEGVAGAMPALAGNRAVTMDSAANLVQIVLRGGFAPATPDQPRPFGMPPFATVLADADIAALLTHLRGSWGHRAPAVSPLEVARFRSALVR